MASPSWDPAQYQRFTDERARPFLDLIGRVATPDPATVVDLGCGQWVPGHVDLLPRWTAALRPGGALAFQIPRSTGVRAGEVFRSVAASPRWAALLADAGAGVGPRSAASPVRPVAEYVDLLAGLGLSIDAWETTYQHVLPGTDPVLEWFSGTGLRPYLDALEFAPRLVAEFRAEVAAGLREAYPPAPYGTILPFPRVFVVAHRA